MEQSKSGREMIQANNEMLHRHKVCAGASMWKEEYVVDRWEKQAFRITAVLHFTSSVILIYYSVWGYRVKWFLDTRMFVILSNDNEECLPNLLPLISVYTGY